MTQCWTRRDSFCCSRILSKRSTCVERIGATGSAGPLRCHDYLYWLMGLSNVNPYPALSPQGQLEALPSTSGLYIPPQLPSALPLGQ